MIMVGWLLMRPPILHLTIDILYLLFFLLLQSTFALIYLHIRVVQHYLRVGMVEEVLSSQ